MAQKPSSAAQKPSSSGTEGRITIRCTADNVGVMRELVKSDPDLLALIESLKAQGLFPGLRGLSITVYGNRDELAQGLRAWPTLRNTKEAS